MRLKTSSGLLRDILENITDGVIVADEKGRFVLFNPAAEKILAIGPLDVEERTWSAVYGCFAQNGTTLVPEFDLPLSRAIRGQTVYDESLFIRNGRNPGGVWISANASPLKDPRGHLCGGIVVFRDVTAQREELERVWMLSAAVEQTADSVIVTNRQGQIEYVNSAASGISGFSRDELIGRTPGLLKSGVHDVAFYERLWSALGRGEVFRDTIVNRKKNGELYHSEQTIAPIRDATGAVCRFVSVGKDVTELRKAAEQTARLRVARSVQQRLFPKSPPRSCGWDLAGAAFPADQTGGDFFDYIDLLDGRTALVIGDVSGHGIDAAIVMATTRAYIRSTALSHPDPGALLTRVNRVLVADLQQNQFVTTLIACIDCPSRSLTFASAGHIEGYVLDEAGTVKARLGSTGIPLGIFPDSATETALCPALKNGDVMVIFTDGVTEAEDGTGQPFGFERALGVVAAQRREPAAVIVDRLCHAVRDFSGPVPQADDITAVVCKCSDTGLDTHP